MEEITQHRKKIMERKIRYDGSIEEHGCIQLKRKDNTIVVFHEIRQSFTITGNQNQITIPKGSYTTAYYWRNKPFNLYFWRDVKGNFLGAYFNIVRNTMIKNNLVSFEDLIIDVFVLPSGEYIVLDEDELPSELPQFENGFVQRSLNNLVVSKNLLLEQVIAETDTIFSHNRCCSLLQMAK
jgi:uncharacterized protein